MDVDSMTVSELKKELKSRGLKVGGKKADLKARLIEALATDSISATDSAHNDDADAEQQTDFADFENYINDEYNKISAQNNGDAADDEAHAVSIDDIIEKQTAADGVEDEEKQILYAADFDLNAPSEVTAPTDSTLPTAEDNTVTAPDFAEDDNALNSPSKVQSRYERFGNAPLDEAAKVESRKRRFAAMADADGVAAIDSTDGGNKKARLDPEVERKRILERAQKFGTKLPANLKLTAEEAAVVHAEQIKRAERFGTQHLLPTEIKRAEFDAKRAERMKRFQTGDNATAEGGAVSEKAGKPGKIIAAEPDQDSTKVAERRLRFGTTAPVETEKKGKKLGPNRKERDQKKFQEFRQFKKNRNNRGNGRGRGRGRGNGRIRGRGRGGGGGGGGRNRSRSRNRNNAGNDGYNGNSNRQQSQPQQAQVQFSAADQAKIAERKMRFSGGL